MFVFVWGCVCVSFIQKICIKLIKRGIKNICNITKFVLILFFKISDSSKNAEKILYSKKSFFTLIIVTKEH